MKRITDRTSYLRGLAEGLGIDREKNENKLMLEMLTVMEEMAQKIVELDGDIDELDEYVASMENDLSDVEDALFADDEDDEDDDEKRTKSWTTTKRWRSIARTAARNSPSAQGRSTSTTTCSARLAGKAF